MLKRTVAIFLAVVLVFCTLPYFPRSIAGLSGEEIGYTFGNIGDLVN